jgi:hypothetical protein
VCLNYKEGQISVKNTFHILVLSPIQKQMRGTYTHELIAKTPEADQPPPGTEAPKKKGKEPE